SALGNGDWYGARLLPGRDQFYPKPGLQSQRPMARLGRRRWRPSLVGCRPRCTAPYLAWNGRHVAVQCGLQPGRSAAVFLLRTLDERNARRYRGLGLAEWQTEGYIPGQRGTVTGHGNESGRETARHIGQGWQYHLMGRSRWSSGGSMGRRNGAYSLAGVQ